MHAEHDLAIEAGEGFCGILSITWTICFATSSGVPSIQLSHSGKPFFWPREIICVFKETPATIEQIYRRIKAQLCL